MNQKTYNTLFFDLDHTLWDYNKAAAETLKALYDDYQLEGKVPFDKEQLCEVFFTINFQLWADYNVGKIDAAFLRKQRFELIFEGLGAGKELLPDDFGPRYIHECPQKSYVLDGSFELLDHLKDRYSMHIITNGFEDVQQTKLKSSGLDQYFREVITSEKAGGKKPGKEIFYYSMRLAGTKPEESLMIGDNFQTDIMGAMGVGMDQAYYNPDATPPPILPSYELRKLVELKGIL